MHTIIKHAIYLIFNTSISTLLAATLMHEKPLKFPEDFNYLGTGSVYLFIVCCLKHIYSKHIQKVI